jgi:hypothetical protein
MTKFLSSSITGQQANDYKSIEEYYDNSARHKSGVDYDYIGAIEKALGIKPIEQTNNTIRFYFLPSFKPEKIYEINLSETNQITKYQSVKGKIWDDLFDKKFDENGMLISGRLKKTEEYVPSVKVQSVSVKNTFVYKYILSLHNDFKMDTMRCIRIKDILVLDGVSIEVHLNINAIVNKFEFTERKYMDTRYNKIIHLVNRKLPALFFIKHPTDLLKKL